MTERGISNCSHSPQIKSDISHCKKCGILLYEDDSAIKSTLFNSYLNCSAKKYLNHLRRRKCSVIGNVK